MTLGQFLNFTEQNPARGLCGRSQQQVSCDDVHIHLPERELGPCPLEELFVVSRLEVRRHHHLRTAVEEGVLAAGGVGLLVLLAQDALDRLLVGIPAG